MAGRAGAILAAALSLGASAAADGGAAGGGLWDPKGPRAVSKAGGLTAAGRQAMGTCELVMANRATASSMRCAGCHDGSIGASIELRTGTDRDGMSHPVEVDYARAAARHPGRYAPPGSLPR